MACLLPFKAPSGEFYLNFTGQIFVMRLHLTAKRGQGQGVQFFRLLSSFPVTEKVRKKEEGKGGKKGGREKCRMTGFGKEVLDLCHKHTLMSLKMGARHPNI